MKFSQPCRGSMSQNIFHRYEMVNFYTPNLTFFTKIVRNEIVSFLPLFDVFWQKLPKISFLLILYHSPFWINSQYREFQKRIFLSPTRSPSAYVYSWLFTTPRTTICIVPSLFLCVKKNNFIFDSIKRSRR